MAKLNTDSATKLYNAVKDAGFDIGDYNAYMTKLQSDPKNADNLYKALHGAGFDIGNDYASKLYSNATPLPNLFDFGNKTDVTIPNAGNGYSFLEPRTKSQEPRTKSQESGQPLTDEKAKKVIYGNVPGTTKIGDVSFLPTGGGYQNTKGKAPVQKPNTDVQVAVPGQSMYGNAPQVKMPTITSEDIDKQAQADLQKQYAGNAYEQAMFKQAQDISKGVTTQEFNPQFYADIPRGAVNATVGIAGSAMTGVGDLYDKAGSLSGIDFYADYGQKLKELGGKADKYVRKHSTGSAGEEFGGMIPMAAMAVGDVASGGSLTPLITGTFAASGYGDGIKMYDELHPNGDGNEYAKTGAGLLYGAVMAGAGNYLMGKAIPKGLISEAVQNVFRSNPELLQTGGEAIVNAFAKQQPTLLKQLATNAGHSVMSMEAMELGKKGIDELYGKHSDVKDWINTATHAAVTGVVFSALTAPFSIHAQSAANTARRDAQGNVTLTFDAKGKPVEVIEGLRGLTPEGKEVKLTQENVNNSFTMTTDDFNRFMAEKGNAQVNDREVFSNNVADTLKRMSGNGNVSVARDEEGNALYVVGQQDGQLMGFDVEGQVRPIPEGADIQTAPMGDVHSAIMNEYDKKSKMGDFGDNVDSNQPALEAIQPAKPNAEEVLRNATADATNFVEAITHAESGNVIEARLHGVDKPINITKGNVVLKEDGSVDVENSDKTFFYKTPDGVLHVGNIEFIEGINSVVPAQEAIDKSVQPVREQLENANAPEYGIGKKVVIADNTDPQNPSNAIVTIIGRDENGNYKVQRDMGNGQVQPGIVQPREILPQFAGVLDAENAAVDYIDPQTGETMTGMLELDTPDKQMMFANGYATIDGKQVGFENVLNPSASLVPLARGQFGKQENLNIQDNEANGLQAAEAGNAEGELGQGGDGTGVQETDNGQQTTDNGQETDKSHEGDLPLTPKGEQEIPQDEKGNLLFEQARPELTIQFLKDNFDPEEIVPTVVARINAINKEISKQEAFKPTGNIQKDALTKKAKREALNALNEQLGYWKDIQEQVTPQNYKPQNETVAQRDARWGEPTSLREMIIRKFIGGVKLRWDDETSADGTVVSRGLGGEYRYSNDERKAHFNFLAANGVTPEQLAHSLWQANAYEPGQFEDMPLYGMDTQEILNEILDVMNSYRSMGEMIKSVDEIRDQYTSQEQAYIDALVASEENQKNVQEIIHNEIDDTTFAELAGLVNLTEEQQNELNNLQNDVTNTGTRETVIGSDSTGSSQQSSEEKQGDTGAIANGTADAGGNQPGDRGAEAIDNEQLLVDNGQLTVDNETPPPLGTPLKREENKTQAEIDTEELDANIASQEHNTNPTEKQKETGIYPKARVNLQGYNITLETLKGTERSGIDEGGQKWSVTMNNHYGELDGTTGYDGDPIDVFVGPNPKEGGIWVVDQTSPNPSKGGEKDREFDESKVMLGFDSAEEAKAAYLSNYEPGWDGFGTITPAGDNFKEWLYDGKKQRKPFSEYKDTPESIEIARNEENLAIPETFTVSSFNEFEKQFNDGKITLDAYKKAFEVLRNNKDTIVSELNSKTKDELIKMLNSWSRYGTKSEKKDRIVTAIYDDMLMTFTFGSIEYDFSTPKDVMIARKVAKSTQADIDNHVSEVRRQREAYIKRVEEYKKALTNPETLSEFKIFIDKNGIDKLSLEQKAKYDELVTDRTQETRKKTQETQVDTSKVDGISMSDVIESKHTKTGEPLYVVKLNDRVEKETYYELNNIAKKLGGGYSSYNKDGAIPGFHFKTREAAEKFRGNQAKEVSTTNETIQEVKTQNKVSKLRDNATKMIESADAELNRERLTNTSKRAAEASRMDDRANEQKRIAQTMLNIADAIDRGDVKLLDGINAKTHIQLLDNLIQQAKYAELNDKYKDYSERLKHQGESATLETIEYLRGGYYPSIYASRLKDLINGSLEKTGVKRIASQWQKITSKLGDHGNYQLKSDKEVQEVQEMLDASKEKYFFDQIKESIANHKRLKVMGIENDSMLRSALREYIQYRGVKGQVDKVKQLERDLVGKNVGIDFFPTPKKVVSEMLDYADIQPGMNVLEPSAGNGNIADAIKEEGIKADVIEISNPLREILEAKGYNLVGTDFMTFTDQKYDRIIMNPPFGTSADIDHVMHAYELLKPNGRIVAIMSEGTFFRNDSKSVKFREFLDNTGSETIDVEAGAFNDKTLLNTTGVKTRIVVIDKNDAAFQIKTENFDTAKTSEEKYTSGKAIIDQLDADGGRETVVAKDNKDFAAMLPAKYEQLVMTRNIGGVYFKGGVIINVDKHDSTDSVLAAYEHEYAHKATREIHSNEQLADMWVNSSESDKQLLRSAYADNPDWVKGDELISLAVEDIIEKQGYENYKSGNIDLSSYSETLQEPLKQTIEYANKEYLDNLRRRNGGGNAPSGDHAGKGIGDLRDTGDGRSASALGREDNGTAGQSQSDVSGAVSGGSEGVLQSPLNPPQGDLPLTPKGEQEILPVTIEVDGVERSTTNSLGQQIHPTETGVMNFWKWFGNSKVVDKEGRPLVVYHGSISDFNEFKLMDSDVFGTKFGHFFTPDKDIAQSFADRAENGVLYATYLKLEHPKKINGFFWDTYSRYKGADASLRKQSPKEYKGGVELPDFKAFREQLQAEGNDGVVLNNISIQGEKTRIVKTPQYIVFEPTQIKSATGNYGGFGVDDADIRHQIIGKKGAEAMDRADASTSSATEATTRLDNLRVAKEMEAKSVDNVDGADRGFTPQEIRLATGWEKGVDGLWRYEVADGEFAYGYYDLIEKGGMKRLPDVFENTEIFKAYPELNNIAVMTDNLGDIGGSYSNKVITLNRNMFGRVDMLSVLIHEIQHAIQEIEGFAKGGNVESMEQSGEELISMVEDIENLIRIAEKNNVDLKTAYENTKGIWKNEDVVKHNSTKTIDEVKAVLKQVKKSTLSPLEQYRRLAGETEARNASTRMNMSEEERRNTLLAETADVAPEDQIVLMNGMGVSESSQTPKSPKGDLPETINVDGVERPTTNSNGKPIHGTVEGIKNFWKWFGDSKVVDKDGRPLVVYHGTGRKFTEFEAIQSSEDFPEAMYFSTSKEIAKSYAGTNGNIFEVYLKEENPHIIDAKNKDFNSFYDEMSSSMHYAKNNNNDGLIVKRIKDDWAQKGGFKSATTYITFDPTQIKSVTGNNGEFDPEDADIRFQIQGYKGSRTTPEYYKQAQSLDDLFGIGKPVHDKKGGETISEYYKRVKAWSVANNPQAWGEADRKEVEDYLAGVTPDSYEDKAQAAQAAAQAAGATVVDIPKPVFQQDGHTSESVSDFARRVVSWREQRFINGIVRAEREAEASEAVAQGFTPIDHETARMELDMQLRTVYDSLGKLIGKHPAKWLEQRAGNKEMWADSLLPVKTFLDYLRSRGVKIPDIDDYYLQATALQGKNDTGFNNYVRKYQKPVNKWIHDTMKKTGFNYRDIENYVFLKHGVERNDYFKQDGKHHRADYAGVYAIATELYAKDNGIPFDPKEKNEIGKVLKEYANANGITLNETSESGIYDELFANKKEAVEQAQVEKNRGFFDKIVNDYITDFEDTVNLEGRSIDDFWAKLNDANNFSLDVMADAGIITRTQADEIKSRYQYFIPLRGHEVEAEKTYEYSPDAGVFFSNPAIKAHGRISRAEHPFSYIAQMAQSAVVMKNNNNLKKTMLRLARKDKTGMFSVNRTWYIKTGTDAEGMDIWEEAEITADEFDELNRAEWEAWNERMKELEKEGRAKQFTKGVDLDGLFIKKKQKKQHAITIIENGEEYQVYINANPRISRAINGLNKTEQDKVMRFLSSVKGMIGMNVTSRSPSFMAANFSRDIGFAASILPAKEGGIYAAKFLSNIGIAGKELVQYQMNSDTAPQHVREFFDNGGETGFSHLWELQDMQKQIDKAVAQGMSASKAWEAIVKPIDIANKIVENTTRLAVYKTSRESGRTVERSISDAKEVTLNFNRSGAGGGIIDYIRPAYLFVNAGIQALSNFIKVYKEHPFKMTAVILSYMMSGLLMPVINSFLLQLSGDDEDEYWNLPDYDRQNNLCIWNPITIEAIGLEKGFLKVPYAQELRVFHRMGDNVAAHLWNKKPMGEAMVNVGAGFLDLIPANPSGPINVSLAEAMPDAIKPFFQLQANKNFTGATIAKDESFMKEGVPQWRQVRTNRANEPKAPAGIIWLSAELNAALGGDQYRSAGAFEKAVLNPDKLNHLARGYFGGVYTTATQGLGTISDRFYMPEKDLEEKTTGSGLQNAYNKIDKAEQQVNQFNQMVEDLKQNKIDRVQFAKDTLGTNYGEAKRIQKLGSRLREINKVLKENQDLPEEEKKQLMEAQKTILKMISD